METFYSLHKNWRKEGRCFVKPLLTFFQEETSCVEPADSDLRYFYILHVCYNKKYSESSCVEPADSDLRYFYILHVCYNKKYSESSCVEPADSDLRYLYINMYFTRKDTLSPLV